jgi:FkbM family methyltransferase
MIRSTFRGWLLPILLVPIASLLASKRPFSRLVALLNTSVRLQTRADGKVLRAPLLDAWPVFEVFAFGEYDFDVLPWERIKWVVDCGANVGAFCVWITGRSPCRVLAVEPNPSAYSLLRENVASLGERVVLKKVAIAGRREIRTLYDDGFPAISSLVMPRNAARTYEVQAITLEELLSTSGFPAIDLLKMDIEGAEKEVLQATSVDTLRRIQAAVIECHPHAGADSEWVADRLRGAGMEVVCEPRLVVAWRQ